MLGLLGFTFVMAASRFGMRRALVLEQANAIGTSLLRAALLSAPMCHEVAQHLAAYVDARLTSYRAGVDADRLATAAAEATRLEHSL